MNTARASKARIKACEAGDRCDEGIMPCHQRYGQTRRPKGPAIVNDSALARRPGAAQHHSGQIWRLESSDVVKNSPRKRALWADRASPGGSFWPGNFTPTWGLCPCCSRTWQGTDDLHALSFAGLIGELPNQEGDVTMALPRAGRLKVRPLSRVSLISTGRC